MVVSETLVATPPALSLLLAALFMVRINRAANIDGFQR